MKKSLLATLAISSLMIVNTAFSAQRVVLVEESTSSTCPPCATLNPTIEAAVEQLGQTTVLFLAYHVWWPSPGNDPMFLSNQTEVQDRISYYDVNTAPDLVTDGNNTPAQPWSQSGLQTTWAQQALNPAPVAIDANFAVDNGMLSVDGEVSLDAGFSVSNNVQVRVAVVEKHIGYTSPPGTNGETDFAGVFRTFVGGSAGYSANLNNGTFTFNGSVSVDPVWNMDEIQVYVWVQDDATKAVHNAALASPNAAPGNFTLDVPAFNTDVANNVPVTFDWADAIDPNPGDQITYELVYDDDATFATPETVTGLTNSTFTTAGNLAIGTYYWKVTASDQVGAATEGLDPAGIFNFSFFNVTQATSIDNNSNLPEGFALSQNFPNPFNPSTTISYELPANLRVANLVITNVRGEKVREFELNNASGSVVWNGTDNLGKSVSSGVYFYKLEAGEFSQTKKMLLLK
ncbi:MAG: T9SS C-terminal target domain-containing protein [Calditrichaeota bacterium]|nr:MAG: T9SS C-terminal target domain-containing protein [Calditrichota bacterium]